VTAFAEHSLLMGLAPAEVDAIIAAAHRKRFVAGERLREQGTADDAVWVVLDGEIALRRRAADAVREQPIGTAAPGDLLGQEALFDAGSVASSAVAMTAGEAWIVPNAVLAAHPRAMVNVARHLATRARVHGEAVAASLQERAAMGELVVKIIVLLCAYALLLAALPIIEQHLPQTSTAISLPVIALFGLVSWRFIRNSGYPLDRFGLGLRNLLPSLLEALVLTPPFAAALVGVKWLLMQTRPAWRALPVIQFPDWRAQLANRHVQELLLVYLISSLVQELIVRSAMQSSLERFLVGPGSKARAIFAAAVLFSSNHLHISFLFAMIALLPGLFWGWMFSRRPHLLGVALSHFFVGGFVFFVLGISLP
jgi:CRP-like cAMP-binding protein